MKVKYANQVAYCYVAEASTQGNLYSINLTDFFPNLDIDDAFLLKRVSMNLALDSNPIRIATAGSDPLLFNWGLLGKEGDENVDMLLHKSLICYKGSAWNKATDGAVFPMGSQDNFIDLQKGGEGTFPVKPVQEVYFAREKSGYVLDDVYYSLRIDYDIVTLTTAEQADLYKRECSGSA